MRLSQAILILLIVGFISQFVYYYPNLPETIVSHFNAAGEPNGWMPKQGFILVEGIILLVIISQFTLPPLLLRKLPNSLINLPNKEYWLSKERRPQTIRTMSIFFEWFAIALLALFIAVIQLAFRANLTKQPLSAIGMWTILGLFFAFTIIWTIIFIRSFRVRN